MASKAIGKFIGVVDQVSMTWTLDIGMPKVNENQASNQASKQASKRASKQASKQACRFSSAWTMRNVRFDYKSLKAVVLTAKRSFRRLRRPSAVLPPPPLPPPPLPPSPPPSL
ncbi:hypothetical protein HZH66_003128 [Vespula vulgaris]|uniref:Uncharacterized protein n=1 Tax=Vespula vulgaris TaxID=7454 RepID=A0A834KKT4_VESVU|nr:hypothetical protein HZH66_003128 [Vespula vulgaris]